MGLPVLFAVLLGTLIKYTNSISAVVCVMGSHPFFDYVVVNNWRCESIEILHYSLGLPQCYSFGFMRTVLNGYGKFYLFYTIDNVRIQFKRQLTHGIAGSYLFFMPPLGINHFKFNDHNNIFLVCRANYSSYKYHCRKCSHTIKHIHTNIDRLKVYCVTTRKFTS